MTFSLSLLPTTLVLVSGLSLSSDATAASTAPRDPVEASASAPAQDKLQDFRAKFREALEARATNEMEKLVRSRKKDAIQAVMTVAVAIGESPNERLEAEIQGLRKSWNSVHKTPFVNRQYELFSLMSPSFKRTRKQLVDAYVKTYAIFEKAVKDKDKSTLAECANQLSEQAEALEEVGDKYQASLAWYFAAQCVDEQYRKDDADLYRAYAAWKSSAEARDGAGLRDDVFQWAEDRRKQLEEAGFGETAADPAEAEAAEAAAAAAALVLEPSFELFEDLGAVRRPCYMADELYQMWNQIYLSAPGSTNKIQTLEDSPTFHRDAVARASIDADGDGKGEIEIPLTGNISPVRFTVGSGDTQREIAILATIGRNDDVYQGFAQNLSPDENNLGISIAPAGSMVTELAGVPVRIFDDNVDGIYGSLGEHVKTWQYIGVAKESFQPEIDSIQIGKSKHAVPFSSMLQVEDTWYSIGVENFGKRLTAQPLTEVETGTVKLKIKGLSMDYLVLQGVGSREGVYVDVMANGNKGVEAPVGTYQLFFGQVSKGKRQQMMKALVLRGKSMNNVVVKPGETTTLELGGPFGFTFEVDQDDETVEVNGNSGDELAIVGQGGETYHRLWNCVPLVEVLVRPAGGKKKGTEIGKLRPSQTQEEMQVHEFGWTSAWFPAGVPLEKGKFADEDVEVQLFQKKNKLFGKIESEWIQ